MFITLLTQNIEGSRAFYERLGYNFTEEQHGAGPRHFSTNIQEMPVELHPPIKTLGDEPFFVGIYVKGDLEATKRDLIDNFGGQEPVPAIPITKSGIISLRDPRGILVRLFPLG